MRDLNYGYTDEFINYMINKYDKIKELCNNIDKKDKEIERLNKQIEKLENENNLLKQLVGNDKQYTIGIR